MSFYLVDDLRQGSSEWLAWRQRVIGASDAPAIMGENPWKSQAYLMKEKLGEGRSFQGNEATREGQRLEPAAREELSSSFGVKLRPQVIQDSEVPYLAASLDGLSQGNDQIFEIKCGVKAYDAARQQNAVPDYYLAQLQHMLMISNHKSLIYAAYRPGKPLVTIEVKRDKSYIARLRTEEVRFMKLLSRRGHKAQGKFIGRKIG